MPAREISAAEAQAWLASGEPPRLVDVREPEEWEICRISGAELLPLSQFTTLAPDKLTEPTQSILVYCHHGVRSAHVAEYLLRQGFTDVVNLRGGIDAWSRDVDSTVPRY